MDDIELRLDSLRYARMRLESKSKIRIARQTQNSLLRTRTIEKELAIMSKQKNQVSIRNAKLLEQASNSLSSMQNLKLTESKQRLELAKIQFSEEIKRNYAEWKRPEYFPPSVHKQQTEIAKHSPRFGPFRQEEENTQIKKHSDEQMENQIRTRIDKFIDKQTDKNIDKGIFIEKEREPERVVTPDEHIPHNLRVSQTSKEWSRPGIFGASMSFGEPEIVSHKPIKEPVPQKDLFRSPPNHFKNLSEVQEESSPKFAGTTSHVHVPYDNQGKDRTSVEFLMDEPLQVEDFDLKPPPTQKSNVKEDLPADIIEFEAAMQIPSLSQPIRPNQSSEPIEFSQNSPIEVIHESVDIPILIAQESPGITAQESKKEFDADYGLPKPKIRKRNEKKAIAEDTRIQDYETFGKEIMSPVEYTVESKDSEIEVIASPIALNTSKTVNSEQSSKSPKIIFDNTKSEGKRFQEISREGLEESMVAKEAPKAEPAKSMNKPKFPSEEQSKTSLKDSQDKPKDSEPPVKAKSSKRHPKSEQIEIEALVDSGKNLDVQELDKKAKKAREKPAQKTVQHSAQKPVEKIPEKPIEEIKEQPDQISESSPRKPSPDKRRKKPPISDSASRKPKQESIQVIDNFSIEEPELPAGQITLSENTERSEDPPLFFDITKAPLPTTTRETDRQGSSSRRQQESSPQKRERSTTIHISEETKSLEKSFSSKSIASSSVMTENITLLKLNQTLNGLSYKQRKDLIEKFASECLTANTRLVRLTSIEVSIEKLENICKSAYRSNSLKPEELALYVFLLATYLPEPFLPPSLLRYKTVFTEDAIVYNMPQDILDIYKALKLFAIESVKRNIISEIEACDLLANTILNYSSSKTQFKRVRESIQKIVLTSLGKSPLSRHRPTT